MSDLSGCLTGSRHGIYQYNYPSLSYYYIPNQEHHGEVATSNLLPGESSSDYFFCTVYTAQYAIIKATFSIMSLI